jgi:hypothetical protein
MSKSIQEKLATLGFNVGTPDGLIGQNTRKAIKAYQKLMGLPADGKATESLLARMNTPAKRQQSIKTNNPEPIKKATAVKPISVDFGNYHALVIGINKYKELPNLKTANNDARTVASLLKQEFGFKVKHLRNPTRDDIINSLNHYRSTLSKKDNLLIYYAGHGVVDKAANAGYWLPSEAAQNNDTHWIALDRVTKTIRAMNAKHVMIVADSCYSGKLTRGLHVKQKAPDYYATMSRRKTRVVMTAGGLEPVLDSGGGGHSVFANAFIRTLLESPSVIDGTDLFTKVRRRVMLDANQTPEYSDIRLAGHDGGDFIFVRQ